MSKCLNVLSCYVGSVDDYVRRDIGMLLRTYSCSRTRPRCWHVCEPCDKRLVMMPEWGGWVEHAANRVQVPADFPDETCSDFGLEQSNRAREC